MQITEIRIEELFGELNITIPLKTAQFATIIYAPNGYGKTTALEIVEAVFHLNFVALSRHIFASVSVCFSDGSMLSINRKPAAPEPDITTLPLALDDISPAVSERSIQPARFQVLLRSSEGGTLRSQEVSPDIDPEVRPPVEMLGRWVMRNLPALERVASGRWLDRQNGEMLRAADIFRRYGHMFPGYGFKAEDWLSSFLEKHPTSLVQTKRLDAELITTSDDLRSDRRRQVPSVVRHSQEMAREIQQILAEFSNLSQKLDRGFPRRLMKVLAKRQPIAPTGAALKELDAKYQRIVKAGILEQSGIEPLDFIEHTNETTEKVIALYVQDQTDKLKVFDTLLEKIETLRTIINSRFQRKQLVVNRQQGYKIDADRGESIPLERLSSGEQHQLVLFHSLLFNMRTNALVMIDEPEISLHVAWQQAFLKDLQRIVRSTGGVHFLVATHSPQIISDHWDLTVDLTGEGKQP